MRSILNINALVSCYSTFNRFFLASVKWSDCDHCRLFFNCEGVVIDIDYLKAVLRLPCRR